MRYLLLLLVALLIAWQWRTARSRRSDRQAPRADEPIEMVACAFCGVHLAKPEAVAGRQGFYCSAAHQRSHGG